MYDMILYLSLFETAQGSTCCSLINSTSFHSKSCPGLDDKCYGHSLLQSYWHTKTLCLSCGIYAHTCSFTHICTWHLVAGSYCCQLRKFLELQKCKWLLNITRTFSNCILPTTRTYMCLKWYHLTHHFYSVIVNKESIIISYVNRNL